MRPVLAAAALAVAACARIEPPPGGPPDQAPPVLRATSPDSLRSLPGFRGEVVFEFDETVSEGSQPNFGLGTGDLERLVVLSPSGEVPVVRWRRERITVRPREGWRPNTVYRVELLPGVSDLARNRTPRGAAVTFTTGEVLPTDSLVGRVVDWTTRRAVPLGLVVATLLPDSLEYRTAADSSGRFVLGPLPRGEYLVYGVVEEGQRNSRRDPRERFDTVRVAAGADSVGEVWAYRHDSTAARITALSRPDSLTVLVTFNMHLDPYQAFSPDSVDLFALPDTTRLPVASMMSEALADSLRRQRADSVARARADSVARARGDTVATPDTLPARPAARPAAADTTPSRIIGVPRLVGGVRRPAGGLAERDTTDRAPLTTRPPLFDKLVIRTDSALREGGRYLVILRGVRSVSAVAADTARSVLIVEERRPPPGADTTRADTARVDTTRADTTRAGPDTVPPARPDTIPPPGQRPSADRFLGPPDRRGRSP